MDHIYKDHPILVIIIILEYLVIFPQGVFAETYYVDSNAGNNNLITRNNVHDLKAEFEHAKKQFIVYANDGGDFNTPANKVKIKVLEDEVMASDSVHRANLKPFSANVWIFSAEYPTDT